MDVIKAVQTYIEKMITQTSGMKILLLDVDTVCVLLQSWWSSNDYIHFYTI
jgi:vacuolar protein sorting-associated protein 45